MGAEPQDWGTEQRHAGPDGRGCLLDRSLALALLAPLAIFAVSRLLLPATLSGARPTLLVSLNASMLTLLALVLSGRRLTVFLWVVAALTVVLWSAWSTPLPLAVVFAVCNIATLLGYRRLLRPVGGARALTLDTPVRIAAVLGGGVAVAAAGCVVSLVAVALNAVLAGRAVPTQDLALVFLRALAQADGMVAITPLLAMIYTQQIRSLSARVWAGLAACLGLLMAGTIVAGRVPGTMPYLPLSIVMFTVMLVVVLRHGRVATAVLTPVFAVAAASVAHGSEGSASVGNWMISSHAYALLACGALWVVAALVVQRDDAVGRVHDALRVRVSAGEDRFAGVLDELPDAVAMLSPRKGEGEAGPSGESRLDAFGLNYVNAAGREWGIAAAAGSWAAGPLGRLVGPGMMAELGSAYTDGHEVVRDAVPGPDGPGGRRRWLDVRACRIGSELLVTWRDVTDRVSAERSVAEDAARYAAALSGLLDPVVIVRPGGRGERHGADFELAYVNDVAAAEWGLSAGRTLLGEVEPSRREAFGGQLLAAFRSGVPVVQDNVHVPWQGGSRPADCYVDVRASRLDDTLLIAWRDVTARRRGEQELAHRALHDPLTGLANRHLFRDHVRLALGDLPRRQDSVAVFYLDVDHFKDINDSLGHEAGDSVLKHVAARVAGSLRQGDTAARLAGDEFVAVARVHDDVDAAGLAERLHARISMPMVVFGETVDVSASVGVTTTRDPHADPDELLREADLAMYQAKGRSSLAWEMYDSSLHQRAVRRLGVQRDLAEACREGWWRLEYQPIVELASGRIVAAEALLRMAHPRRGLLLPGEFIDVAEASDFMVALGSWVLRTACEDASSWRRASGVPVRVSVNVSARQVRSGGLTDLVREATQRAGLDPADVTAEITERVLLDAGPSTLSDLLALTGAGCRLAIDDFGTGYSSLTYLKRFPVTTVKIDKSFVDGLGRDDEDTAIVTAVTGLAATLRLDVVAEGVESGEQAQVLRDLGCDNAQGYLFGRPMPSRELVSRLVGQGVP